MKHKYNAIPTVVDGIKFPSRLESQVYTIFKKAELSMVLQPEYLLQPSFRDKNNKFIHPIKYKADFIINTPVYSYLIDVKGLLLPEHRIKAKMLKYQGHDLIYIRNVTQAKKFVELLPQNIEPFKIEALL